MERIVIAERKETVARIALVEDGRVSEIRYFDLNAPEQNSAVYLSRVESLQPALDAAFVDIGSGREAFLPLEGKKIKQGDYLIVQGFAAQTNPDKRYRVSHRICLAGRWLVYQPGKGKISISGEIRDAAAREKLKMLLGGQLEEGEGAILRTAAAAASESDLAAELETLRREWRQMEARAQTERVPGVLRAYGYEDELISRFLNKPVQKVLTDDEACYQHLLQIREEGQLAGETEVCLTSGQDRAPGVLYGVDTAEEKALHRVHWLPCGGYLTVDYCEALTVYDVNSGKTNPKGGGEETALKVNLEAAVAAARHLRLCNTGGIVIIDFIDMARQEHRSLLEETLRRTLKEDSAMTKVYGLTRLGLMELTRKRSGLQLRQVKGKKACASGQENRARQG